MLSRGFPAHLLTLKKKNKTAEQGKNPIGPNLKQTQSTERKKTTEAPLGLTMGFGPDLEGKGRPGLRRRGWRGPPGRP